MPHGQALFLVRAPPLRRVAFEDWKPARAESTKLLTSRLPPGAGLGPANEWAYRHGVRWHGRVSQAHLPRRREHQQRLAARLREAQRCPERRRGRLSPRPGRRREVDVPGVGIQRSIRRGNVVGRWQRTRPRRMRSTSCSSRGAGDDGARFLYTRAPDAAFGPLAIARHVHKFQIERSWCALQF